MKSVKNKHFILLIIVSLVAASVQFNIPKEEAAAVSYCTTEKCKAAEAREREAAAQANRASEAANTLEAEVRRLGDEIKMYEARIAANEAIAEDLQVQIAENTAKLELQQQALANMLINLHFEEYPDAIMVLAGSNSLSDYAEKQSRADTAKNQVNLSAQTVKKLKEDLEAQKAEVERVIADQELQRAAIAETKSAQEALIIQYQSNAAAYTAEAEAARSEKESEIAAEIARLNSSGAVGSGINSYPYRNNCPRDNLRYGSGYEYGGSWGYVCQCVSYAGWKAYEYGRMLGRNIYISGWGNANTWANAARSIGYRVDTTPAANTIAVSVSGVYGHVMWVESVNSNGTINISEYNNAYSSASGSWGDYGYRIGVSPAGLQFIHF